MNLFKNIFARIWAVWGLVSFVITFLIFFLPSMFAYLFKDEVKGQKYFIRISRIWMNIWLTLIGCPVKIYGRQNFKEGDIYIVTFNHNALLDVPLSAPYVPGANKTIAKASFTKVPLFGLFYRRGSVLVNRSDENSRIKSFEDMKQVLAKGMHMCIYPEGTRNRTGKPLKDFYEGAFKLAVDTQNEIMPCVITGTRRAMPVNKKFYLLPVPLKMYFLEPVTPGYNSKELRQKVYDLMLKKYIEKTVPE
ncbi:MAG: lysophospholipid acyltransferase family protein [Ferruginibacter sp.]